MARANPEYTQVYRETTRLLDKGLGEIRDAYHLPKTDIQVELFMPEMPGAVAYARPGRITFGIVPLSMTFPEKKFSWQLDELVKLWSFYGIPEQQVLGTKEALELKPWYTAFTLIYLSSRAGVLNEETLPHALQKVPLPSDAGRLRDTDMIRKAGTWAASRVDTKGLVSTYIHEAIHTIQYQDSVLAKAWLSAMEPFCTGTPHLPSPDSFIDAVKLDLCVSPVIEGTATGTSARMCGVKRQKFERDLEREACSLMLKYAGYNMVYQALGVKGEIPDTWAAIQGFKDTARKYYRDPLAFA